MNPTAGTTWTCPQGHEVGATSEFCPQDGSPKPVPPSAAWGQTTTQQQPTWGQPTGQQLPPWGQPSTWQPPSPPKRGLPVWGIVAIVVAAVLVLGGIIGLVAWGIASSSGSGFNNVTTLENSIQSTYEGRVSGFGVTITNVSCVSSGDRQYNCVIELSDGNSVSHHVTVSSDGHRWTSDNS